MASSPTPQACAEQKLPDNNYQITKRLQRAQWLRAAILGANDGLLSTSSLMLGVGAAKDDRISMVLSGLAGALAGACSMAVGEFVSVSTQRDIENEAITLCSSKAEMCGQHDQIKISITASPITSFEDAKQGENIEKMSPVKIGEPKLLPITSPGRSPMMKVITEDAKTNNTLPVLREYHREETLPNPYKAAAASALAFLCGSFVPLVSAAFVAENNMRIAVIVVVTSLALALFGGVGARLGGSSVRLSAVRVLLGGWIAMAITYGLLKPFDRDHEDHISKD